LRYPSGISLKRLVIDLDDTLTRPDPARSYAEKEPNLPVIEKLREYQADGFEIIVQTARNMRTHNNSIGKINAHTLPVIIEWLKRHDVPYDEIHVGKPWCGADGFYVDDRAIRPSEFLALSLDEIQALFRQEGS
jgi:capsule biosynthesis phosphatase